MTRNELLDLYFMDARSKVIDIAAFLDRVERGSGEVDFRFSALKNAIKELESGEPTRARKVLISLSDLTQEPLNVSNNSKGAVGAWMGC